jgi:hypothetical protein
MVTRCGERASQPKYYSRIFLASLFAEARPRWHAPWHGVEAIQTNAEIRPIWRPPDQLLRTACRLRTDSERAESRDSDVLQRLGRKLKPDRMSAFRTTLSIHGDVAENGCRLGGVEAAIQPLPTPDVVTKQARSGGSYLALGLVS